MFCHNFAETRANGMKALTDPLNLMKGNKVFAKDEDIFTWQENAGVFVVLM